jgi:predicted 3-demethylubiquinone-9 3-methyltransferase (glyoxalase superfamily)
LYEVGAAAGRSVGGDPKARQCGGLKDEYGVSCQAVSRGMARMLKAPGPAGTKRVKASILNRKKLDMAEIQRAYAR